MNTMPYWQIFYYSKICSSHGIWEGRYNELIFSCPIISPTQILLIVWSTVHFWYQQCHSPRFFIWTQSAFLSWTQQEMWQSFYGASLMWIIVADSRIVSCQCHHWALAPEWQRCPCDCYHIHHLWLSGLRIPLAWLGQRPREWVWRWCHFSESMNFQTGHTHC